ncbi:hypothetical protein DY000_02004878 [Brassica cretica]|uniref:Uncharacterized protein n=1 Tax=Brassica cretica TaxID=69181 RepID=A0ABQ7C9Z4_BRACR|nr:hypothetical protein DY000_02004878 [Brassica cretica]
MDSYPFRFLITWTVFSGIGVPHGVLGNIWVYLELKRGVNVIIGRAERWKRPSRSDTVKSLRPALSERPYQSDAEKSLTFSSPGDTKTGPERRLAATPPVAETQSLKPTTTLFELNELNASCSWSLVY